MSVYTYPDLNGRLANAIGDFLSKKSEMRPEEQFLLYVTDILKDQEEIKARLRRGEIVILDRYIASTLAYQSSAGFSLDKGMKILALLGFALPDVTVFLDIPVSVSASRKMRQKGTLDRFEADKKMLERVRGAYIGLARGGTVSKKWIRINANRKAGDVAKDVQKAVSSHLK